MSAVAKPLSDNLSQAILDFARDAGRGKTVQSLGFGQATKAKVA